METDEDLPRIIRVVCDLAPLHPRRKPVVPVNTFRHLGQGRWTTQNESPWLRRQLQARDQYDVGTTLAGDTPVQSGSWREARRDQVDTRNVYLLECFQCHHYTSSLREETMFGLLDDLRDTRQDVVVLRDVAARLGGTAQA